MSASMDIADRVKEWRRKTKERMIVAMGNCCQCCGYSKCADALDFHHRDPNQKDFGFGKVRANCCSWLKIANELRKCVLVCSNCHREIHAGVRKVPENASTFDEKFLDYKMLEKEDRFDICDVCGTLKPSRKRTCSRICSSKRRVGNRWEQYDIKKLIEIDKMNYEAIGRLVGCSGGAVKKRYIKTKALI
jgi:hypothetical protein